MRCSRSEGQDDLLLIVRRVEALGKFLDTDDGKNLLAGVKRAANILRIEEKKDGTTYTRRAGSDSSICQDEEQALAARDRRRQGRSRRGRRARRTSQPR